MMNLFDFLCLLRNYALQITMDRQEHGGVSGASIKEAVSWGKVDSKGKWIDVIGAFTICFMNGITNVFPIYGKNCNIYRISRIFTN